MYILIRPQHCANGYCVIIIIERIIIHGDRPHNYLSNDIFGFAVYPGFMKILPIEKCIIFFETPCIIQMVLKLTSCMCYVNMVNKKDAGEALCHQLVLILTHETQ